MNYGKRNKKCRLQKKRNRRQEQVKTNSVKKEKKENDS